MSSSPFVFEIGADVSKFTKSISEVDAELKNLRNVLKTQTGAAIVETNKQIVALETSLVNLKKVGLDQLPKSASNGTNALFSLNQVARDLPFGFIAIQNNLPLVADEFSRLVKTSGGVKGALSSLGGALAGPAGLSFAIGAAISGITALVQKYGTLESAIQNVFGITKSAKDIQNEYTLGLKTTIGETESEINSLKNLTDILTNNNLTLNQRNGAYEELNKKYPGLLANLDEEKAKTGELNTEIAKRLLLYSKQIELSGKQDFLNKLISKGYEEQSEALYDLTNPNFWGTLGNQLKGMVNGDFSPFTSALTGSVATMKNVSASTNAYRGILKDVQTELSGVNGQIEKFIKDAKDAAAASKEGANALKQQNKEWEQFQEQTRESNKRLAEFYTEQLQNQALKNRTEELKKQAEAQKQLVKQMQEGANIQMQIDAAGFDPLKQISKTTQPLAIEQDIAFNQGQKIEYLKSQFLSLQSVFDKTKSGIESSLVEPFGLLFDNLTTKGKSAFEGFGKMAIGIIKKIAAQLIASGIANLISNILFPQIGAAKGIMSTISSFTKGGGFLGFGGVANPSFGGVNGGGMSLSGQVVFVQRGSDLVGALNRTNAQINRVG